VKRKYITLTLCTDLEDAVLTGTSSDMGYKLDFALRPTTDYIQGALNKAGYGQGWSIISHSLSFVDNRCILSILLKSNHI